jgi:glycosyltransferase involved in cell wall biosynthesis
MKPRRVLFVDFYSFVGGGQQNLLSVFRAMDRRRYTPLLALPREGAFADAARALKVPVFITSMGKARWRQPWQAWPAMRRLRKLMQAQAVDLVHANCYPANKLAGPAAKPLGIPVLWHKQIAVTQRPRSTTAKLWAFFSRYNRRVLAVSIQGFEGLAAMGIPREKLGLLYNNADTDALDKAKPVSDAVLKKLGVPTQGPLVLAAGMRRPHKGFDILLQAWKLLVSHPLSPRPSGGGGRRPGGGPRVPQPHLVLLGDPADSEPAHEVLLRRLAADPALKGTLTVLPAQRPFAPWLKRADLFVSSSRWEGSPLVVIEAMAAGTPVLATHQASGEIIEPGKTGILVHHDEVEGLAEGLRTVLGALPAARKRAALAKREARRRFSLKGYVRDLAHQYDEMFA